MPGLFENMGIGGGILGLLTGQGAGPGGLAGAFSPALRQEAIQQQQLQATYQALGPLIQQAYPNLPAEHQNALARAATLDPEIRKQITPNLNQRPELVETGNDPLTGQKTFAEKNFQGGHYSLQQLPTQQAGQATGVPGAGPGDAGLSMETFKNAVNSGVKGDDLYQHMPTGAREFVRSLVENRAQVSPMMLRNPQMLPYFQAANIIDPTFDAANYPARQAGMKYWKGGPGSEVQKAANQAAIHLSDVLLPAIKNLDNVGIPILNSIANPIAEQAFGTKEQNNFRIAAEAAANEVAKIYRAGGKLSDSAVNEWRKNLNENMSPEQMKGAVATLRQLYQGGMEALHDKRINDVGSAAASKMGPLITEKGQKALDKIDAYIGGGQPSQAQQQPAAPQVQEGSTAVNKQTGQRIIFKGGQWQPAP
jgi:hypothetical protein